MPSALPTTTVFGARLRQAREAKGWTQTQLGRALGLEDANTAAPRISRYERGLHEPDLDTLYQLSAALGVDASYFFAVEPKHETVMEFAVLFSTLDSCHQSRAFNGLQGLAALSSAPSLRPIARGRRNRSVAR